MFVKWEQLKRILKLEESFEATAGEYESYLIPDHLSIRIEHSDLDSGIYTATYVQLFKYDDDPKVVCSIQLEGQPNEPICFFIDNDEIDVQVYRQETPNELFWPVL